jgi:hypothetical protein
VLDLVRRQGHWSRRPARVAQITASLHDAARHDTDSWFLIGRDGTEALAMGLVHPFRTVGRIVVTEYISVDGVVEAPSGDESFERVGWTDAFSRGLEGEKFKLDETMNSDALLLGRLTYEGFAPVWPHYAGELADKFNTMP